jgi:glycosyltransferase involved in cell wall biosynthesis
MSSTLDVQPSSVAILIPCYNEGPTIGKVVRDFRRCVPTAEVYVFDNLSTDDTADRAAAAGAIVVREKKRGKGFVVAAMLSKVDADCYVMVDGDDTYPAERAMDLLSPILAGEADMVVGQRLAQHEERAFRPLHVLGNRLVCGLINLVFSTDLVDPMSGFRAFTREVAASLSVIAWGFDIETEMTLQLLYKRFVIREVAVSYRSRPEGSASKLRTFRDGAVVLAKILSIARAYKPLTFFGALALLACAVGAVIGIFPVMEYLENRYVYSVPKAVLAASCFTLATVLAAVGIIISTLNYRILEMTNVLSKQISHSGHAVPPIPESLMMTGHTERLPAGSDRVRAPERP